MEKRSKIGKKDMEYMKMALQLAQKGIGNVSPNPMVGAIVVKDGRIIGRGYHKFFGGSHAEVYALDEGGTDVWGGTLYVTLEPCSHYGKTPPCAQKIIDMGIKKCYIGSRDPNPEVSGKGIAMLRKAGIEVVEDVLKKECNELNQVFFKYITTRSSYLFIKCGITLDGKIALSNGISRWITNSEAREKVQYYRNKFMGIMVGINTVLTDNPRLTVRTHGGRNPYRIIVDPKLKMKEGMSIIKENNDEKTIIITSGNRKGTGRQKELEERYSIKFIYLEGEEFSIKEILAKTGEYGIDSILLEGGEKLISQAFKEKEVDGGEIFIANKILGDSSSKPFISGFSPKEMEDAIILKNVRNNIYGENVGMEFYMNIYNEERESVK